MTREGDGIMNGPTFHREAVAQIDREQLLEFGLSGQWGNFLSRLFVTDILKWFLGQTLKTILYPKVAFWKVRYASQNARGAEAILSGLVIVPLDGLNRPVPDTLLGFQHGTVLEKRLAPSTFDLSRPLDYLEVLIAAAYAMDGYTVVIADYPGLGVDPGDHPYMNAKPLAVSVADLLVAVKNQICASSGFPNPRLFLTGYSEGGYATMAVARELQSNRKYAGPLRVLAAAPLAGAYDLSGTMRELMLQKAAYGDGYYLPMTIRGLHACYGDAYGDGIFTGARALKPEYQFLFDLVDGYHPVDEVQKYMPPVPREILAPAFIAQLENERSAACRALRENDLYHWTPEMPMYLYHSPDDDRVPYANSRIASASFMRRKRMIPVVPTFSLPLPGSEHGKAAPVCFLTSSVWLKLFRKAAKN